MSDYDALQEALNEWADALRTHEEETAQSLGVTLQTAEGIVYLRERSRWTQAKEDEMIARDKAGNPIPLCDVLSGDF